MACRIRIAFSAVAAATLATAAHFAGAIDYPVRPVRLIVSTPPGGGDDFMARLLATKLDAPLGQHVVVDNRPGASGMIGVEMVAHSAPDGYTLIVGHFGTFGTNPSLFRKLPYDPVRDFAPVSLFASVPLMLIAHPSLAANTLPELVQYAKANPGKLSYASASNGAPGHLAAELMKSTFGLDILHVPYKGPAAAATALIGGETQLMFATMPTALPQYKAGRLKVLAFAGLRRSSVIPEVPTLAESGAPGFEAALWTGVLAPAATPQPVVGTLSREIARLAQDNEVKERLASQGGEAVGSSPERFAAFIKAEIAKWAKVINGAQIRID
jgi:tripartite-type tricarboxylate transporter receptor subunit TctC